MELQTIVVALLILAAAVHLGRYIWRLGRNLFKKSSEAGCPSCGECAFAPVTKANQTPPIGNFVSLDQIRLG